MKDYFELREIWYHKRDNTHKLINITRWPKWVILLVFGTALALLILALNYLIALCAFIVMAIALAFIGVYESIVATKYHHYDDLTRKQDHARWVREHQKLCSNP